jgi:hypothetical protein
MQNQYLLEPLSDDKIDELSPEEMKILLRGERDLNKSRKIFTSATPHLSC